MKPFTDFIWWFYPFVEGGVMGYIAVSLIKLSDCYKKVKAILGSRIFSIRDNLDKKPTKREIEKRQKLIPIYLTILSILIALININGNYSQDILGNIKTVPAANLGFFELLLVIINIIILSFNFLILAFFIFILFIIAYYTMLDQNSKQANKYGIGASICFGTIFSIALYLFTSSTGLGWWRLSILVLMSVIMSLIVAYSLVWTSNEKKPLKWPLKEQNS